MLRTSVLNHTHVGYYGIFYLIIWHQVEHLIESERRQTVYKCEHSSFFRSIERVSRIQNHN